MDEQIRQRELDDVDAGLAPQEVLQRTADATREQRDQALAELSASLTDEQILDSYGPRGVHLSHTSPGVRPLAPRV